MIGCNHSTENEPIIIHDPPVTNPLKEYYFDTTAVSIDLPQKLIDTAGSFTIEVTRNIGYSQAKRLTLKAESFFPPDSVIPLYFGPSSTTESRWWFETFDGTRLPYAITGSAIEYYINRIRWFQQNVSYMSSAYFKYNSTFDYYENCVVGNIKYEQVFVVEQEMEWMQYCGPLCAMGFHKKRIILFDNNENIIAVIGDQIAGAWVS
jgi:hypothetical protein